MSVFNAPFVRGVSTAREMIRGHETPLPPPEQPEALPLLDPQYTETGGALWRERRTRDC